MDALLQELGAWVDQRMPHMRQVFDVYAAEAAFGREWLQPRLAALPAGASLLEVGAGLMLLSTQLASEGYDVTALEPIGSGFSDFRALQAIVREYAQARGVRFQVLAVPAEELADSERYDLAYSINVMEHVQDVAATVRNVVRALKPAGSYVFICPNYRFPYEPHFGIPIVGSKALTERLFGRWIRRSRRVLDAEGTWKSLNWITVGTVEAVCRRLGGVRCTYDTGALSQALERVTRDAEFASRRAAWMRALARGLVATGLHRVGRLLPAPVQPLIDCRIVKAAR